MMTPSEWPKGIHVERAMRRWPARRSADRFKKTIQLLAARAQSLEWFDAAVADFLTECECYSRSSTPPSRRLSIRIIRRCAQHYRRIVRKQRYLEVAARQALMAGAG
jgi:hypothetical protein